MTRPGDSPSPDEGRRRRDLWQLHVPLVIVLTLCAVLTVVEARRAGDGVWRAWAYMFEWPLIGLFAVWIWHRYRTQGSVTKGLADRWRAHVAQYGAELDADRDPPRVDEQGTVDPPPADPGLEAWRDYVDDLHRRDPPGGPPAGG